MNKKISVIITTLNASKTIQGFLDSLNEQESKEFELLIVDGGSSDDTISIIKKSTISITLLIRKGKSIYGGINEAIAFCKTDYYIVCGSDDRLFPYSLKSILTEINLGQSYDILLYSVQKGDNIIKSNPPTKLKKILGWQSIVSSHSVGSVFKTSLHKELGSYSEDYHLLADGHFFTKILNKKKYSIHISEIIIGNFGMQGSSNKNYYNNIYTTFLIQTEYYNFYIQLFILVYRLLKYKKRIIYNNG